MVYYNEWDQFCAQWLRNLIAKGLIPKGHVDERSITEVQADEIRHYKQWHFFAGVSGWSQALKLAGWPEDRSILTGSCPCQPFSSAGKRKGKEDERHLWPHLARLIRDLRPPVCVGEQVASKDGLNWFDGVSSDLEDAGYSVGTADLPAASIGTKAEGWVRRGDSLTLEPIIVGAPHIRQRLYWVALAGREQREWRSSVGRSTGTNPAERNQETTDDQRSGTVGDMADSDGPGQQSGGGPVRSELGDYFGRGGPVGIMGNTDGFRENPFRGVFRGPESECSGVPNGPGGSDVSVGDTDGERLRRDAGAASGAKAKGRRRGKADGGPRLLSGSPSPNDISLGDTKCGGCEGGPERSVAPQADQSSTGGRPVPPGVAQGDTERSGLQGQRWPGSGAGERGRESANAREATGGSGPDVGSTFWADFDIVHCTDQKARRIEPRSFPLVDGSQFRLADGRTRNDTSRAKVLRGLGNAIVPPLAAEFIRSVMDILDQQE